MTENFVTSRFLQSPLAAVLIGAVFSIIGAGVMTLASFAISNSTTITGMQKQLEARQEAAHKAFERIDTRINSREVEWNQKSSQFEIRINELETLTTTLQTHLDRLDRLIVQAESFEQRLISLERSRDVYNDYFEKLLANMVDQNP